MATLEQAIASGRLDSYELPDWEVRNPVRPLYVTPEFFDAVDAHPKMHDKKFSVGARTLGEHLEQMFCEFRCAKHVHGSDLRRMMPTASGIWHMYPPKLRVYGWAPAKHAFAAVAFAFEADTKVTKSLNDIKRDEVLGFIRLHGLAATVTMGDIREVFPQES